MLGLERSALLSPRQIQAAPLSHRALSLVPRHGPNIASQAPIFTLPYKLVKAQRPRRQLPAISIRTVVVIATSEPYSEGGRN